MNLKLSELDTDSAKIVGEELALENRENGKVYLTSKSYMDKLFKLIGYKSLSVVKIIHEYAGKVVSEVGDLRDDNYIYLDEVTDSFIVATEGAVNWVNKFYDRLDKDGYKVIEERRYDTYYQWDQLVVESPNGTRFAIYIDLLDEAVYALCLSYKDEVLVGLANEGIYQFNEGDASLESLMILMSNPIDLSCDFKMDQRLSLYEFADLLFRLGYLGKKRGGKYFTTDEAFEIQDYIGNLESIVDLINESSWLQRRIREVPTGFNFEDACKLISINLDKKTFWSMKDIYISNSTETSDFFALNY